MCQLNRGSGFRVSSVRDVIIRTRFLGVTIV